MLYQLSYSRFESNMSSNTADCASAHLSIAWFGLGILRLVHADGPNARETLSMESASPGLVRILHPSDPGPPVAEIPLPVKS